MLELIQKISENLQQHKYQNETAVREQIVQPVLRALDWDTSDPDQVYPEYGVKTGRHGAGTKRIDYALFTDYNPDNPKPQVIIEVKNVGKIEAGDLQLAEYAYHEGTSLAILTDGREWRIYYPFYQDKVEERLVRSLDLSNQGHDEIKEYLSRYLSFAEVKSGNAAKNAEKDLKNKKNRKQAKQAIPKAWQKMFVDDPDELINMLIEKTAHEAGGIAPDRDDVVAFLKEKTQSQPPFSQAPQAPRTYATQTRPVQSIQQQRRASPRDASSYILFGEKRDGLNAIRAYMEVIIRLTEKCGGGDFLNQLASRLAPRHISRDASALGDPVEIGYGWFINKHLPNNHKRENLKRACDVAGIQFGSESGLKINFPNMNRM